MRVLNSWISWMPTHNPKSSFEPLVQAVDADSMRHVLVGRPTHKAMEVFGEPLIPFGDEAMAALRTTVEGGSAFNNPPPHSTGGDHQVKCALQPVPLTLRRFRELGQIIATATRTLSRLLKNSDGSLLARIDPQRVVGAA